MAEEQENQEQSDKVEVDKDELAKLKASSADMSKWKKRAQKAEGDLGELRETVGDLEKKVEGLSKPKEGGGEPDTKVQIADAVDEALKKAHKEAEKATAAMRERFNKERAADAALTEANVSPKYRDYAISKLDLDNVDVDDLKDKVAEFVKEHSEVVTSVEPQPPTPDPAGPGGKAGSDKPVTDYQQASENMLKDMENQGLSFDK